jgi:hypothetical protein
VSSPVEVPIRQVSLWRVRVVRVAALCSLLSILVPLYVAVFRDFIWQDRIHLLVPILFFPLWLPYGWVFGRLSSKNTTAIKKALATALIWGVFVLALASFLLIETFFELDAETIVVSIIVVLQIGLLLAAIAAYYSMERRRGDTRILVTQLWLPVACIAVAALVIPKLDMTKPAPLEASSLGSLQTIRAAQTQYALIHPGKGFASSLSELGPSGSDLIDSTLASGRKSQYTFTLNATPADSEGHISQYSVIARPQEFEKNKLSFFIDETGIVRFTSENRVPTSEDSPIQ